MRRRVLKVKSEWDHLIVFDFDDTLAHTEEATLVRNKKHNRIVDHLYGQASYDAHELSKKHYYDFSEFLTVSSEAEPIEITLRLLRQFQKDSDTKVIVLTARQPEARGSIKSFLRGQGVAGISIFGVDGSVNKKAWLSKLIKRFNISKSVTVFEDSVNNIKDLLTTEYDFPDLSFEFVQVINPDMCEDIEEAKRFSYPTGENGTEPYQRMLKRIHPKMKRRLLGLGSNDYLEKGVKKLKDFSRSKSAPPAG
jgi:hypothetical protein